MGTMMRSSGVVAELNELVEREYDARAAFRTALEHLTDERDRIQVTNFLASHERHLHELTQAIGELGGAPEKRGDFRALIKQGKVLLGAMVGEQAIVVAMKTNADALGNAYKQLRTRSELPPRWRTMIERCYADQKWHSSWLEERLGLHPDVGEAIMADEGENVRAARNSRPSLPERESRHSHP